MNLILSEGECRFIARRFYLRFAGIKESDEPLLVDDCWSLVHRWLV
jgi:hypothetical protein